MSHNKWSFRRASTVLSLLSCLTVTSCLLLRTGRAAEPTRVFQAGFAEADITPELGMEAPGGYGKSYHQSVHDPCKVRAAVFDDGTQCVAVVGVDGLAVHGQMVQATRQTIQQRCGIPPHAIMIAASHSHSSGPIFGVYPGSYDHATPEVQKLAYEQSTCANPQYLETLKQQIVSAVCAAHSNRTVVHGGAGQGIEDQVAFNRRFRMANGLTFTHPGQGNPDIVEVAGPTDPEVGVIGVWNDQQRLLGCVVNFACHATTSPGGISANYVYYLERVIRGAFGDQVVVVFVPGTSGDVTQVDNRSPYRHPSGEVWAQRVGGRVGAEAVKVLLSMERGQLVPVAAAEQVLQIPRRAPTPARLAHCRELVQKEITEVGQTDWTFAKEVVMLDALLQTQPNADVLVQAVQIGPVVLLGAPAEMFCQFGLTMKARSPFPLTFPVSFANDCVGYIPTEEAFGEHGGGYETRLTSYTNMDISAGQQIVNTALKLAGQMQPGDNPAPPAAPEFREPWSYGNLPPEQQ